MIKLSNGETKELIRVFKEVIKDIEYFKDNLQKNVNVRIHSKYNKEGYRDILILVGCKISSNKTYINYGYASYDDEPLLNKLNEWLENDKYDLYDGYIGLMFDIIENRTMIIDAIKNEIDCVRRSLKAVYDYESNVRGE